LPNQSTLSANVIVESEEILGEGTFGVVKVGFYQTLGVKCAIKAGKNSLFNGMSNHATISRVLVFSVCIWRF